MKYCLVVDDSRVIRKVACRILKELAFETGEAEDAAAALELCRLKMPDAILLDWSMPELNGVEFVRTLRREQNGRKPIILLCATENDIGYISEAINAGANEYLIKPFDREILASKLTEIGLLPA